MSSVFGQYFYNFLRHQFSWTSEISKMICLQDRVPTQLIYVDYSCSNEKHLTMRTHYEVFSRSALLAGISACILIVRVLFKLSTINSFNVLNIWTISVK